MSVGQPRQGLGAVGSSVIRDTIPTNRLSVCIRQGRYSLKVRSIKYCPSKQEYHCF